MGGGRDLPLSLVPDKRQPSKQRRAARNRASRDALAARRENAVASASAPAGRAADTSSSTSSSSSGPSRPARPSLWGALGGGAGGRRGAAGAGAPAAPPPDSGLKGIFWGNRVGDKAVTIAFLFAVASAIALLFYQVPADDRGEPLPAVFRGIAIAAREQVTGAEVGDDTVSLLDASGPAILFILALPVLVTAFALWGNRRPDRSRMLTFAMLAMAGTVLFTGSIALFFFPALIALAVAGFRVRKADLPARVAERATASTGSAGAERPSLGSLFGFGGPRSRTARSSGGRGGVIDADSTEVADDAAGDVSDADEPSANGGDRPAR